MKRSIAILGAALGITAFAAHAGPLTLNFFGDGIGSISLPDDTLITTGSLYIAHDGSTLSPAGYAATGYAVLLATGSPPGYPPVLKGSPYGRIVEFGPGSINSWSISLSYADGFAYGGFYTSWNTGSSFGKVQFGGYSTAEYASARAARDIGNTWKVTNGNVPIAPTVFLLGLGLVGIVVARRKQA